MAYIQIPALKGDGRAIVTTAGTRVRITSTSTKCTRIDIVAETDNTGVIVIGGSTVIASLATRRGIPLNAGEVYSLSINNLNQIYLDSSVNGDGITYVYYV